jgi:hypothetical protein
LQDRFACFFASTVQPLEGCAYGPLSLSLGLLAHRSEIDRRELDNRSIVVTSNRDHLRHRNAATSQPIDQTNGAMIIEGSHCRWQLIKPQQVLGGSPAISLGASARKDPHVIGVAVAPHGHPVAAPSVS